MGARCVTVWRQRRHWYGCVLAKNEDMGACWIGAEQQWRQGCVLARDGNIGAFAVWMLSSSGDGCLLVKQRKEKWNRAGRALTRNGGMGACWVGAERQRDTDVFVVGVDKQWSHGCALGGCYANGQWPAKPTEMMYAT